MHPGRMIWQPPVVVLFLFFALWGPPALSQGRNPAMASSPSSDLSFPKEFRAGMMEVGLWGGAGSSHNVGGSETGLNFTTLAPRWGYFLTNEHGPRPFRGSLEVVVEPLPAFVVFNSSTVYGAGLNTTAKYNFSPIGRFVPFFEIGAGVLFTTRRFPERRFQFNASTFNFSLLAGPGVHFFLTRRASIVAAYRFWHSSNANITDRNPGSNQSMGMVGLSFLF